jgi:cyclohexanecarboxylate-CoA ligase
MFPSHDGREVQLTAERLSRMQEAQLWNYRHFSSYFESRVSERPDQLYLVSHLAEAGTSATYTYQAFDELVRRATYGLHALGVRRGHMVSYQLPNRMEFLVVTLACARLGAVTNPLMTILRERELTFMVGLTEARVLVVPSTFRGFDHLEMALSVQRNVASLEHVLAIDATGPHSFADHLMAEVPDDVDLNAIVRDNQPDPNDLLEVMFTSGTTGEPKGAMHSTNTLLSNVAPLAARLNVTDNDVVVCPTPLAHQLGYMFGVLMPPLLGGTIVLQDTWSPKVCAELIEAHRGTLCLGATPFLADLADLPELADYDISSLQMFVSGGAPIPPPLVVRAKENLRADIVSIWGMTEVAAPSTVLPGDHDDKVFNTDGVSIPPSEVIVLNEHDEELPRGQSGILKTRGPNVFLGYLKRPALYGHNADGWFDTGDLARMDDDGYIRITGRSKDMIIRGGDNIPIVEIENLMYQMQAVQTVAIVGMPDKRLGERACAFVVVKPGSSLTLADVVAFLSDRKVTKSYFPERLEILDAMPMTATGKIQKFVLREQAKDLSAS